MVQALLNFELKWKTIHCWRRYWETYINRNRAKVHNEPHKSFWRKYGWRDSMVKWKVYSSNKVKVKKIRKLLEKTWLQTKIKSIQRWCFEKWKRSRRLFNGCIWWWTRKLWWKHRMIYHTFTLIKIIYH